MNQKKKKPANAGFFTCARRFELPTFWSVAKRSIQLSYAHILSFGQHEYITTADFVCQALYFFFFQGILRAFGLDWAREKGKLASTPKAAESALLIIDFARPFGRGRSPAPPYDQKRCYRLGFSGCFGRGADKSCLPVPLLNRKRDHLKQASLSAPKTHPFRHYFIDSLASGHASGLTAPNMFVSGHHYTADLSRFGRRDRQTCPRAQCCGIRVSDH